MRKPKDGEFWVACLNGRDTVVLYRERALIGSQDTAYEVYEPGDEQGWRSDRDSFDIVFVRRIRL